MYNQKYLPVVEENQFTVDCSYYNLPVKPYSSLISCIYIPKNLVYLIEEIEHGFKVIGKLSPREYNYILFDEYKALNLDLVLTGSLALHMYKPLDKMVNNINALCDILKFRDIQQQIVPRDYYCLNNTDNRSWGVFHKYNVEVLVKNQLSYHVIDDVRIADINDIISSQIWLGINVNTSYFKNVVAYIDMCDNLKSNSFG